MKTIELGEHQRKAVAELSNGKILCGGVGTGKSRVAMQYYVEKESPRDVYIITTAKKRDSLDWDGEAVAHGVGKAKDSTFAGVLTVDSWNNISKYEHVKGGFFIFDEQRLVGSGAWVKSFYKIARANRWILLSATPGDTWLDYIPVFVANGMYKNRTEFLREHVVYNTFSKFPKVDRYIAVGRLVRHRNHLLVKMPYDRHTVRHIKEITVEHDENLLRRVVKERWNVITNEPVKNIAELFSVMRRVVNSDPSRVEAVKKLILEHPRLIVFYNFDYELEALRNTFGTNSKKDLRNGSSPEDGNTQTLEMKHSVTSTKHDLGQQQNFEQMDSTSQQLKPTWQSLPKFDRNERAGNLAQSLEELQTSEKPKTDLKLTTPTPTSNSRKTQELQSGMPSTKNYKDGTTTNTHFSSPIPQSKTLKDGLAETTTTTPHTPISKTNDLSSTLIEQNPTSFNQTSKSSKQKPTIQVAEWNGHRHDPVPSGSGNWVYLVQYTAGAEGWNCVETNACVFYSLNYSYRVFEQCQGRIDRMNTLYVHLMYYVLKSDSAIDRAIWKAIKSKKFFNEKSFLGFDGKQAKT